MSLPRSPTGRLTLRVAIRRRWLDAACDSLVPEVAMVSIWNEAMSEKLNWHSDARYGRSKGGQR